MNLKYTHLSDDHLLNQTHATAKREQQMTLELLDYLLEVDRRRVFAVRGYRSLFQYAVEALGYSSGQASERVNAIRLIRDQPQIRTQVQAGALTLTSAAQIQRFVQAEKKSGTTVTCEQTIELIQACEGKPTREVERILLNTASSPAQYAMKERTRLLPRDRTELKFSIGEKTEKKLERVKNLIGHLTLEDLFDRALEALTDREEKKRGIQRRDGRLASNFDSTQLAVISPNPSPHASTISSVNSTRAPARVKRSGAQEQNELSASSGTASQPADQTQDLKALALPCQSTSAKAFVAAHHTRFIPIDFKRKLFARSGGQCEYTDPKTGRRCNSKYRLQIDHRTPLALGGRTEFDNLRHLCFQHNARAAIEMGLSRPA